MTRMTLPVACALTACLATSAGAQAPVAVVEEVKGKVSGVEFMDYVTPGTKIELGRNATVVLSYTKSCRREMITGGTVTVGAEQSAVEHGKIEYRIVDCDAGRIELSEREASQSAATVFRKLSPQEAEAPQITLHGRSPVVETNGPGALVIERLDRPGERHEFVVGRKSLVHGRFYDLARAHTGLTPGATYRATVGALKVAFKVDARAKSGATPIVGRLLRLTQVR